ncbi:MAG: amino acid-binding protein [Aquificaceae bacterium]|nr:amino acid-binding protein [Aquificaceae bacterium]MCS7196678.1 amino acid-binding protein [Aquificaceae bacterium]MCX7990164.1 amino acid-binding protein [Aquificaceae bacterium]MDW8033179.1 ACT domain-containing protein [Aquificaceae bacterium]MDW8295077.1 ACT domain-containing protein [Aquificaceae bacterium]
MKFFMLSLFGKDRPGIVAGVSKALYELGMNLEDSSMTRLNGEFTIMLIVGSDRDISAEEVLQSLKEVGQEFELFMVCRELEDVVYPQAEAIYRVVVFGSDKPGIVYGVTSKLASLGFNISDLRTEKRGGLYVMVMEVEGREDWEEVLREGLEEVRQSLGVDVSFEREEEERL